MVAWFLRHRALLGLLLHWLLLLSLLCWLLFVLPPPFLSAYSLGELIQSQGFKNHLHADAFPINISSLGLSPELRMCQGELQIRSIWLFFWPGHERYWNPTPSEPAAGLDGVGPAKKTHPTSQVTEASGTAFPSWPKRKGLELHSSMFILPRLALLSVLSLNGWLCLHLK